MYSKALLLCLTLGSYVQAQFTFGQDYFLTVTPPSSQYKINPSNPWPSNSNNIISWELSAGEVIVDPGWPSSGSSNNPTKFAGGAQAAVTITRRVDQYSPSLFQAMAAGAPIRTIAITSKASNNASSTVYQKWVFENAFFISLDWSLGNDHSPPMVETLQFMWQRQSFTYQPVDQASGKLSMPVTGSWDALAQSGF